MASSSKDDPGSRKRKFDLIMSGSPTLPIVRLRFLSIPDCVTRPEQPPKLKRADLVPYRPWCNRTSQMPKLEIMVPILVVGSDDARSTDDDMSDLEIGSINAGTELSEGNDSRGDDLVYEIQEAETGLRAYIDYLKMDSKYCYKVAFKDPTQEPKWMDTDELGDKYQDEHSHRLLHEFYLKRREECLMWLRNSGSVELLDCEPEKVAYGIEIEGYVPADFDSHPVEDLLPPDYRNLYLILQEAVKYVPIEDSTVQEFLTKYGRVPPLPTDKERLICSDYVADLVYQVFRNIDEELCMDVLYRAHIIATAPRMYDQYDAFEAYLNGITKGKPVVRIENSIDLAFPPSSYEFINHAVYPNNVGHRKLNRFGCKCTGNCKSHRTFCCQSINEGVAYSFDKKLLLGEYRPIVECGDRCRCNLSCRNRVIQDGYKSLQGLRFAIFRTPQHEWGLKTLKKISKGTFVMLVAGEIIDRTENNARDQNPSKYPGGRDVYDLMYASYNKQFYLDFTMKGNLIKFVKQSSSPNLQLNWYFWNTLKQPSIPRPALFAKEDIPAGTELTVGNIDMKDFKLKLTAAITLSECPPW